MSAFRNLDRTGRRRSPATMPGYHSGRPPANTTTRRLELVQPPLYLAEVGESRRSPADRRR